MPTKKKPTEQVVDIETLQQDTRNFNRGTAEGEKLMDKSFQTLGAGRSILIDRNGNIIAGNKSQLAAMKAGIRKVRVIETDGSELVAVKRTDVDIDSKKGRELALADNVTTQVNLAWDEAQLAEVAPQYGIDTSAWGVDLPAAANPLEAQETKEDNFDPDAEKVEPVTKYGDIWQLGNHILMCGDSTKRKDVERLMNGKLADLWLTDPPYNVGYGVSENKLRSQQDLHAPIDNDLMGRDNYYNFIFNSCLQAANALKEGGAYYFWLVDKQQFNVQKALEQVGMPYKCELIWNKNHFVLSFNDYKQKHENCVYGWKPGKKHYFIDIKNKSSVIEDAAEIDIDKMSKQEMRDLLHQIYDNPVPTTVIECAKPVKSELHPTMKPIRLFAQLIVNSSLPGQIVLDTFGGSGTTIIACEQLQRQCRMMELDPHYCDVIIQRWEKFTEKKAVKISDSKPVGQ